MSLEQVKDRTSNAVGSGSDEGGLFDETIAAYKLRRKAAADYLVSTLVDSHSKAFRTYIDRTHWTPASDEAVIGSCASSWLLANWKLTPSQTPASSP